MVGQLSRRSGPARPSTPFDWRDPRVRAIGPAVAVSLTFVIASAQPRLYPELPIAVLYLAPVVILVWTSSRRVGLAGAAIAAVLRVLIDVTHPHAISHWSVPVWNFVISLPLYVLIAALLLNVRDLLERELEMAMTDALTRLGNRRFFLDVARVELNRSRRYGRPFALGYIDVDYFKEVNDRMGHASGDALLCLVAKQLMVVLRTSDVVARIGGDEFAFLLPETPAAGAEVAVAKMNEHLLASVREAGYPVTFSIGVITWDSGNATLDELLDEADRMMYEVKHSTKGGVRFAHGRSVSVTHGDAAGPYSARRGVSTLG